MVIQICVAAMFLFGMAALGYVMYTTYHAASE